MKLVGKGAEANLYLEKDRLIKHRIKKEYRIGVLDERLRRSRTKREAKLLKRSKRSGIPVPNVYDVNFKDNKIVMEFIDAELVYDYLQSAKKSAIVNISKKIGELIARLHDSNIIHNDLTTSNMLLKDDEIYLIDFGLGMTSTRIEDKAMDLVVLHKSLMSAYPAMVDMLWIGIRGGYENYLSQREVWKRVEKIEQRVRYVKKD